jgi:hypothetical protein
LVDKTKLNEHLSIFKKLTEIGQLKNLSIGSDEADRLIALRKQADWYVDYL